MDVQNQLVTTTTREALICGCGHKGTLLCKENDAPFSALYEAYSLAGFKGGRIVVDNWSKMPADILAALQPICPECGRGDRITYA